jgi:uncharacterized protein YoxC
MESAAEILVIILAVVLSVFLIVGIILVIYLIRLSAEIRKIAESAQKTVDHIEGAVDDISRFASPIFFGQIIGKYIRKFTKQSRRKGDK